jgi:hypothetical protein
MNDDNKTALMEKAMLVQLTELNNRSRWYSSELWQVPFAYLGLTGLIIGQVANKAHAYLPPVLFVSGLFGVFVFIHMESIREYEQTAIAKLRKIEEDLRLGEPVITKSGLKTFEWLIIFAVVIYYLAAYYLSILFIINEAVTLFGI